ncbi:hypothetical protein U27_04875 [Candidatus Vecturithrix granuli]|uniref:Uncharacterized protein n=1 Tax=Vecturithrix granuli TaxID=1499967 RepID=A0A081BZZ8_VECG1|nr:hypothetical protein U27_04875 [Candidatus Vecturithrix granuli]
MILLAGVLFFSGNGVVIGQHENQTDIRLEIGFLSRDMRIEQTFLASQNNLTRIDFRLDSHRPWDTPSLVCRLFELDIQAQPAELSYQSLNEHLIEVRSQRLDGWLLSPHTYNTFAFEPIPDSQGKRYLLSIQAPDLKQGGSTIILASPKKRFESDQFFVGNQPKNSDLAFRALYALPRYQLIPKTAAHVALQKPFPFSQPAVLYLLVGLYFTLLFLLVWRLSRSGVC